MLLSEIVCNQIRQNKLSVADNGDQLLDPLFRIREPPADCITGTEPLDDIPESFWTFLGIQEIINGAAGEGHMLPQMK